MGIKRKVCAVLMLFTMSISVNVHSAEAQENIETVEVLGKKPPEYFLAKYKVKRDRFIQEYNSLIANEDFKMSCERSRKNRRSNNLDVCQPLFITRIKQQEYQNATQFGRYNQEEFDIRELKSANKIKQQRAEFDKSLAELINSNSALRAKFVEFIGALDVYEKALENSRD